MAGRGGGLASATWTPKHVHEPVRSEQRWRFQCAHNHTCMVDCLMLAALRTSSFEGTRADPDSPTARRVYWHLIWRAPSIRGFTAPVDGERERDLLSA